MFFLDATCPLVTKVHIEAERHFADGREIVLIGHAGHPEVIGTMGQLPAGAITPDRDGGGCRGLHAARPRQSRLRHADDALGRRHQRHRRDAAAALPGDPGPHKEDICYATTNRQEAVKQWRPRSMR